MNRPAEPSRPRLFYVWGVAALVFVCVLAAGAVATAYLVPHHHRPLSEAVFMAAPAAVGAAVIVGVVLVLRRQGVRRFQPSPLLAVNGRERKRIVRAIRREEPFPPDVDHEVAQATANQLAQKSRWPRLVFPTVMVLALVPGAVGSTVAPVGRAVSVAAIACWMLLVGHNLVLTRRAQRRQDRAQGWGGTS